MSSQIWRCFAESVSQSPLKDKADNGQVATRLLSFPFRASEVRVVQFKGEKGAIKWSALDEIEGLREGLMGRYRKQLLEKGSEIVTRPYLDFYQFRKSGERSCLTVSFWKMLSPQKTGKKKRKEKPHLINFSVNHSLKPISDPPKKSACFFSLPVLLDTAVSKGWGVYLT